MIHNLLTGSGCSIVRSIIFVTAASLFLLLGFQETFATPNFAEDNTNSLLEGIVPSENTTSSNVSSRDITSGGDDDTTSSGDDDTTSSGDDDTTSSGDEKNSPIQLKSSPTENKLEVRKGDDSFRVDESFASTDGLVITKRGGTTIKVGLAVEKTFAACHDDEIAVGGGYNIKYDQDLTVTSQFAENHENNHNWIIFFKNSNSEPVDVTTYAECLKMANK